MATKSILKNVEIKTEKELEALLDALERSEAMPAKRVKLSGPVITVDGEMVKEMFKGKFKNENDL